MLDIEKQAKECSKQYIQLLKLSILETTDLFSLPTNLEAIGNCRWKLLESPEPGSRSEWGKWPGNGKQDQ
jgi:hypothetical protein